MTDCNTILLLFFFYFIFEGLFHSYNFLSNRQHVLYTTIEEWLFGIILKDGL